MKQIITKREKYLILFSIFVFLSLVGAGLNMTAMRHNTEKMPIYEKDKIVIPINNNSHFVFSNRSEVNYFILTDIFKISLLGEGYFSIGDLLYFLGGLGSLFFGISWIGEVIIEWKQQREK